MEIIEQRVYGTFTSLSDEVRQHRTGFLIFGLVLSLLGVAAIVFPFAASLAVNLMLGWILTIAGIVGIVQAFRTHRWRGFWPALLGGILSLAIGLLLIVFPVAGIASLTFLIGIFFVAGGILRILLAVTLRPSDHWVWMFLSGILALVLAGLIFGLWPQATWVLGLLVGIDLLFGGIGSIMLAAAARRMA